MKKPMPYLDKILFILYGGPGREKEVSISSGKNIMSALNEAGIPYEAIFIDQEGKWNYKSEALSQTEGLNILKEKNALVFQVIHGTYGEDGELTHLLEEKGIAFVGSSSQAMILTIDKFQTEKKLQEQNIRATKSVLVDNLSFINELSISFPAFVKPKDEGSSVSLFKVKNKEELSKALAVSIPVYGEVLVQPFIAGRELTCGVIEIGGESKALTPTEIILTKGETFDYEAKYTIGGSKEVTPAEIDKETMTRVQNLALLVHTVCGCKDISRTDMILQEDGNLVVLEINTIPGMTKTSFIPAQLEASGYSTVDFIESMLQKYSD